MRAITYEKLKLKWEQTKESGLNCLSDVEPQEKDDKTENAFNKDPAT